MVPTSKTIKSLFARSGNRCAFPDCYVPLVEENDIVTGEVCHIKARNARGPRYDPSQTDAERNDSANLILLCARHHKIVDDTPAAYSVQILLRHEEGARIGWRDHNHFCNCETGRVAASEPHYQCSRRSLRLSDPCAKRHHQERRTFQTQNHIPD